MDDTFTLYDLKVEVVAGDRPFVSHPGGRLLLAGTEQPPAQGDYPHRPEQCEALSRQHESLPLGEGARGTRADEGKQAGIPSSVSRLRETREPPLHYGAIATGNC